MDHLYFVVHTHWDREWYQPFQRMRARLVAMADRMMPLVESGAIPSFHFDGQTIVLEDYLEVRPHAERRLRGLIRAGKVQVGPWYVLADSFLVSGESLIRNLEIGMEHARRFGRALDVGYLPDQFGHIAQMPQILAGFGFRSAMLWRGVGADVNRNRFVWEALDGSSVLTIYTPHGYSNGANLPLESVESFLARADEIARRERSYADGAPILVMNGTDHAEPDPRLMARINEAREISAMTFEVGPLETYVNRIAELPRNGTPHRAGELRSPLRSHLLPGVTSARTWIKQRDFENCRLLERYADPLAALANARGRHSDVASYLDLAWRSEIQNHPHDSICGCSVDQVHQDMRYRFDQAAMLGETVVRSASNDCLSDCASDAAAIAVFNPTLGRRALVSGEVKVADANACYVVETADGRRLAASCDVARASRRRISFVADDLAQAGFSFYRLVRDESASTRDSSDATSIENEFYRLTPTARGLEIRDLARNAEMELYFEDEGDRGDEYNFDAVAGDAPISTPASFSARVIDRGPARSRIVISIVFEVPAALSDDRDARTPGCERLDLKLTATLFAGLDRVDLVAEITNRSRDHRLRAALCTPVGPVDAVHDTSFGVIRRALAPVEPRGTEDIYATVPHRSFTAVEGNAQSGADFSALLASRGIYEVEVRPAESGATILLTLLRCVGWLSRSDLKMRRGGAGPELETPGAQELAMHRFEFCVAGFAGSHLDGDLMQRVEGYTSPPRLFGGKAAVATAASLALIACDNPRVIFSTARPGRRAGAYKVRVYSASPSSERVRFLFGAGFSARMVDLAGRAVKRPGMRRARDGALELELRPFEIATFEVRRAQLVARPQRA